MPKYFNILASNAGRLKTLNVLAVCVTLLSLNLCSEICRSQQGDVPPPPPPGMNIPDPLDVCHDSIERLETLLRRFPKLSKEGNPLLCIFSCEDVWSHGDEPYHMDSARKYQIVELLLKFGAKPNDGMILGDCYDSAMAELLIKYGARVDDEYDLELKSTLAEEFQYIANPSGGLRGKLIKGTGHTLLFSVTSDWPGWCEGWRSAPWSFDASTSDSITARRLGFMKVLLAHGAKPNSKHGSMLINLIRNIHSRWANDEAIGDTIPPFTLSLVKSIVEAGAKVNVVSDDVTPLLVAVESHWPAAVEYLLSKGANVNFRDRNRDPILFHAIRNKQKDDEDVDQVKTLEDERIIEILRDHGGVEK